MHKLKTDFEARLQGERMKGRFVRVRRAELIAFFGDLTQMSDLWPNVPGSTLNIHALLSSYFSQVVLFLLFSLI